MGARASSWVQACVLTLLGHPALHWVGQACPPNGLRVSRELKPSFPVQLSPHLRSFRSFSSFLLAPHSRHTTVNQAGLTVQSPKYVLAFAHISRSHQNAFTLLL